MIGETIGIGGAGMAIQIFGRKKCFDTKKAERFFKERGVPFQKIDLAEKGMSRGEFESVCRAAGGPEALLDPKAKDRQTLLLFRYLREEDKAEKLLENQQLIRTPVVRSGRLATVGYRPDEWEKWL